MQEQSRGRGRMLFYPLALCLLERAHPDNRP